MPPAPPKLIEILVGLLVPPASREHVLGDLHERFRGTGQYIADAIRTLPMVIASRIRRTTDPDLFLLEALGVYVAFFGAAWCLDRAFLLSEWGWLGIPALVILGATTLAAAYADPRRRSPLQPIQEATFGVGFGFLSQAALSTINPECAAPRWVMVAAGGMSILLISTLRMFLSSSANRPQGATTNGPLLWQNQVTRLMEYVGLTIVIGGFGAMVLFIVYLFHNKVQ